MFLIGIIFRICHKFFGCSSETQKKAIQMMKTFPLLKIFPLNIQSFGKLPEEGHWDETMFPTIKYVVFYTSASTMKIPFIIRRLVLSEYRLVYYGACYCCCFTTPHLYKIIFQLFFLSCYFFRLGVFFWCVSEKLLSDARAQKICIHTPFVHA